MDGYEVKLGLAQDKSLFTTPEMRNKSRQCACHTTVVCGSTTADPKSAAHTPVSGHAQYHITAAHSTSSNTMYNDLGRFVSRRISLGLFARDGHGHEHAAVGGKQ